MLVLDVLEDLEVEGWGGGVGTWRRQDKRGGTGLPVV